MRDIEGGHHTFLPSVTAFGFSIIRQRLWEYSLVNSMPGGKHIFLS